MTENKTFFTLCANGMVSKEFPTNSITTKIRFADEFKPCRTFKVSNI